MRMYISILRIRDKWYLYSPDLSIRKEIDEEDFHNRNIVSYVEGETLRQMPKAKMPVIVATKQWLLEHGEDYRSTFISCIPVEFRVRSKDGVIEGDNSQA